MANENVNAQATQAQAEPKIIAAYTVYRYENGNTVVDNAKIEGIQELSTAQILTDIAVVAKQVEEKRMEDLQYNACIRAIDDYMTAVNNQRAAAEAEAKAQVEMPKE